MALAITLGCLAGVLLLLGSLLFLPLDLTLRIRRRQGFSVQFRYRALHGVLRGSLEPRKAEITKPAKTEEPSPRTPGPTKWHRYLVAAGRTRGLAPRLLRFVPDLLRSIRLRELFLNLRVGLDDPALTGEFYGSLCTVLVPIQALPGSCVSVQPDFDGLVLDGEFQTEIRVIPARLLGTCMALLFSPPVLRAGGAVLRERLQ